MKVAENPEESISGSVPIWNFSVLRGQEEGFRAACNSAICGAGFSLRVLAPAKPKEPQAEACAT